MREYLIGYVVFLSAKDIEFTEEWAPRCTFSYLVIKELKEQTLISHDDLNFKPSGLVLWCSTTELKRNLWLAREIFG